MVVCPYDCDWCALSTCRADVCEMTGEPPLTECIECGALVVRTVGLRICIECMTVQVRTSNGGD